MNRISFLFVVFFSTALLVNAQDVKKEFYGMWTIEIEGGSVGWLGVNED
jgi:DICT domain-containing protein